MRIETSRSLVLGWSRRRRRAGRSACSPASFSVAWRSGPRRSSRQRIHLPRVAVDQFNATRPVSDPQPGDLVFFANTYEPGISHVGIYIGNGMQVNAPTTGQVVSVASVFTGYWGAHFAGAHRVQM